MRYVKDQLGFEKPKIGYHPIASATNIAAGAYVSISAGLVIAAVNTLTTALLGVTASSHLGTNNTLKAWDDAETVAVYDSPTAVFAMPCAQITATTNSTTNTVEATGIAAFGAANVFQGGYLEIVSLDTNSSVTDPVGTKKIISAFDHTNKIFTAAFTGAVVAGDVFYLYPPKGCYVGEIGSAATNLVYTATVNGPTRVVGWDFDNKEVQIGARFHAFGNDED